MLIKCSVGFSKAGLGIGFFPCGPLQQMRIADICDDRYGGEALSHSCLFFLPQRCAEVKSWSQPIQSPDAQCY